MNYEKPVLEQKNMYETPLLVGLSDMAGATNVCLTAGFVEQQQQAE